MKKFLLLLAVLYLMHLGVCADSEKDEYGKIIAENIYDFGIDEEQGNEEELILEEDELGEEYGGEEGQLNEEEWLAEEWEEEVNDQKGYGGDEDYGDYSGNDDDYI